jgi:hypothetical protein
MAITTRTPIGLEIPGSVRDETFAEIADAMGEANAQTLKFNIVLGRLVGQSEFRSTELRAALSLSTMLRDPEETAGALRHHLAIYSGQLDPGGEQRPKSSSWHADTPFVAMEFASSCLPARILTIGEGYYRRVIGERTLRMMNGGRLPDDDNIEEMIDDGKLGEFSAEPGDVVRMVPGTFHKARGNETNDPIDRTHILHAFSGLLNFKQAGRINLLKLIFSGETQSRN